MDTPDLNRRNDNELQRFADELEKLTAEKHDVSDAILDLCAEARKAGLHVQALKELVRRRMETSEDRAARTEREDALDRYLAALGMLADTPLGQAAAAAATAETRRVA